MKLKIRYLRGGDADEWTSEEENVLHRWDMISLIFLLLISLSALIAGQTGPVTLSESAPGGFILWFLSCCAYPVLGIFGLFNMLLQIQSTVPVQFLTVRHPVLGLWVVDLISIFCVWGIGRLCGLRRDWVLHLRTAGNFLWILIGWGVFQLLLFGVACVLRYGGFGR